MSLEEGSYLATIIGLPAAALGLFLTVRQIRGAQRVTETDLLLRLREAFRHHDPVNVALRPGGAWTNGGGPNDADWPAVDAYLGLFEVCEHMLQNRQLSQSMFRNQYLYRVQNIRANAHIVTRISDERDSWSSLIALLERYDLAIPPTIVEN